MADLTFSLAIPHAPWVEGRKGSFWRLADSIFGESASDLPSYTCWRVFDEKAPNAVWSAEMWEWGASQSTTHFLTLQDDAIVSLSFSDSLRDIVATHPNEVIGLHVAHPHAAALQEEGRYGWCTTADALVGVAYCLPTPLLKEFLHWRSTCLKDGALESINEDTLLGLWCLYTGRRIYHPLPTIVDHDTSLISAYGNDGHTYRASACFARERFTDNWRVGTYTPHLGRMWDGTVTLAEQWVKDITPQDLLRMRADDGRPEKRRIMHAKKGRETPGETPRILVCTPTRGGVHPEYAASVWRMLRDEAYQVDVGWELDDVQAWGSDVVRVRNRMVQYFLHRTAATHLLFVDSDVSFTLECVRGMLVCDKDFVASPYPRRDSLDFKRVRDVQHVPPEAAAYRYSCRMLDGAVIQPDNCLEVEGVPLGMALLSREMLHDMSERYAAECYPDVLPGNYPIMAPSLFGLELEGGKHLLSEDYSFCSRWRGMGGNVWLYLGLGSPVTHWGDHGFHGAIESFGYSRKVGK